MSLPFYYFFLTNFPGLCETRLGVPLFLRKHISAKTHLVRINAGVNTKIRLYKKTLMPRQYAKLCLEYFKSFCYHQDFTIFDKDKRKIKSTMENAV